ncbi:MAG TPA: response regulator [Usitatibacter sp.]|nr:response regulator [Usitatibacter sp.]
MTSESPKASEPWHAPEAPTVYVVDDDASTRELLAWLMRRHGIAAQVFADAQSFLEVYRPGAGGCLILDLHMPGMSGLDLQQTLKQQGVLLPVIFLSGGADVPQAVKAVKEGAIDFIEKPFDYRRVVALIEDCLRRDTAERAGRERRRAWAGRLALVTKREREVLDRVLAGKLNREIAEELDISVKTVEAHRAKIMEKLEVNSVAELVQATLAGADGV